MTYLIQKTFAVNGQKRWYQGQTADGRIYLTGHPEFAKVYETRELAESAIKRFGINKLKQVEIVPKEEI